MSHRHSQSVGRISSGLLSRLRCYANDGKHSSEQQRFHVRNQTALLQGVYHRESQFKCLRSRVTVHVESRIGTCAVSSLSGV